MAAFFWVGLFVFAIGIVVLFKHEGTTGDTRVWKIFATSSPGIGVMALGAVFMAMGLPSAISNWHDSPSSASAAEPPIANMHRATPTPPSPTREECGATNCNNGARCIPQNVDAVAWQVNVSGVGQRSDQGVIDLGRSSEWRNVQVCIKLGREMDGRSGCVPLEAAVRVGGAPVAALQNLSSTELERDGLTVQITGLKNDEEQQFTGSRKLDVSPKNVCTGYAIGASHGYYVSLFLVDPRSG